MRNQISARAPHKLGQVLIVTAVTLLSIGARGEQPGQKDLTERERFALLVGVDRYLEPAFDTLRGPGNDVELFKQLLINHYRFPEDGSLPQNQRHIATLIGVQATRKAITETFRSQLIDNARKHRGAVVVFYFSGHGSLRRDTSGTYGGQEHMTIVPSDRSDSVLDITDEEINGWFEELREYTQEITFVLDSCYSGTATRAITGSLVVKEVPPQKIARQPAAAGSKSRDSRQAEYFDNGFINPNDAYAAIYACLRYELSHETDLPDGHGGSRRYGIFTYYLVNTLGSDRFISYREAIDQVAKAIERDYGQHPEIEGAPGKPVFAASADWEDPFLTITSGPISGRAFTINGGSILGLEEGTFLAIYKANAKKLVGETYKLATAQVTKVENFAASAQLIGTVRLPIPDNSKVAIVTPNFGSLRARIDLHEGVKAAGLSAEEQAFITAVKAKFNASPLAAVVAAADGSSSPQPGDLRLQRGCIDAMGSPSWTVTTDPVRPAGACKSPAYYINTALHPDPIFGFWVRPDDSAADKVVEVVEQYAKQENLRALRNARSPLNGKVNLSLVRVNVGVDASGKKYIASEEDVHATGTVHVREGQRFRLKVANDFNRPLDIVIFALGTGGSVTILTRRNVGEEVKAGTTWETDRVFIFDLPTGIETYKVLAYTHPNDSEESPIFITLEQKGATKLTDRELKNPLSWLVNQAGAGRRDPRVELDIDLSSWTVAQFDVVIDK